MNLLLFLVSFIMMGSGLCLTTMGIFILVTELLKNGI